MATPKQAVLLIHGIGFQRPMRTLRGFVEQAWTNQPQLLNGKSGHAWSKPDTVSRSFELRRLTTVANKHDVRTDFFEFYWAHLMKGTTLQEVGMWVRSLMLRPWSRVPRPLKLPYILLWLAVPLVVLAQVNAALDASNKLWTSAPVATAIASVLLFPALAWLLREFMGDAAVYLDDTPHNIQRRHEIRSAGVDLLDVLHARGYVRIVVVGHSLGSVIGYDILKYAWAKMHAKIDPARQASTPALDAVEAMLQPDVAFKQTEFAGLQEAYLAELQASGHPWRVTDFVTLGSPLTHAELLLARDHADLSKKIGDRELPACPPVTEARDGRANISFLDRSGAEPVRVPHHAALFAATRWTNLYFPSKWLLHGDFIGGPLQGQFGPGIADIEVSTTKWGGYLAHTNYWLPAAEGDTHLQELANALRLG